MGSGLPIGHNDRIKVDQYLRVVDHSEIYVAGDLAAVTGGDTGRVLSPLAQVALEQGEAVARNLLAEIEGRPPEPFVLHDRGLVVSLGEKSGVDLPRPSDRPRFSLGSFSLAQLPGLSRTSSWQFAIASPVPDPASVPPGSSG